MRKFIILAILLFAPFKVFAGFPEGEKGYDYKKIEEAFRLPCDEIGNDDCFARAFGVGACTWVFGIKKGKDPTEALQIADKVLIALLKGNNLDIKTIFEEDGSIKETRKTLLRILEKKEQDEWVEVSDEVYDYFEERVFIENNLEANRRLKEQFMSN